MRKNNKLKLEILRSLMVVLTGVISVKLLQQSGNYNFVSLVAGLLLGCASMVELE